MKVLDVERSVQDRYQKASQECEVDLCCHVQYDKKYLEVIPQEVIEKDYGCGDPSKYLHPGETVLDLGSGAGKICFIAAQIVGPHGRVIGVDMTDDMLSVARRNAPLVAERLGYTNVEFRKGRIQDLALDLERLDQELGKNPITSADSYLASNDIVGDLRTRHPLVSSDSVDVVVSNCVLNLVEASSKPHLFQEIFRVLRKGGRAVIADIVSDEVVPAHLQADSQLWSGCISGALTEDAFLKAFENAGFYGVEILKRDVKPWRTVEGIEVRSMTIQAWKGKEGPCIERNQAVIYKGPFKEVLDDDGHRFERGTRHAVCDKAYRLYKKEPYQGHFEFVDPLTEVPLDEAKPFDRSRSQSRHPRETKGMEYKRTTKTVSCGSGDDENCCP